MVRQPVPPASSHEPVEGPDITNVVIEDDEPVDNIYSEKQQRLLTGPLYASWQAPEGPEGEARTFVATANVGLFATAHEPPLVPDVLLSVGVEVNPDFTHEKKHRTYFIWEMGKPPEVVIEVVSNKIGGELGKRKHGYARMAVAYYVVWDPEGYLDGDELVAFERRGDLYIPLELPVMFPSLGLSLAPWEGVFEGVRSRWLRWHTDGHPVPTGAELAATERDRAEAERDRADRLAALLREHGIDPEGA